MVRIETAVRPSAVDRGDVDVVADFLLVLIVIRDLLVGDADEPNYTASVRLHTGSGPSDRP